MQKQQLMQELIGLSRSTPAKTREVFWLCVELQRINEEVAKMEQISEAGADEILSSITELRRKLIDLIGE